MTPQQAFNKDLLQYRIFQTEKEMGEHAADFVKDEIAKAIDAKGYANLILATGTSQFMFLESLKSKEVDWQKVNVFHLDEYQDISDQHPASFRKYLMDRILSDVKPRRVFLINGDAGDTREEIMRYADLLKEHPTDVACIGIGENGHIAFNDPPVADFNDPELVKVVQLDEACRMQQLGEGWFPTLESVPRKALTLTIPAIMNAKVISCVVPGERKAKAIYNTLHGEIETVCPASILRRHPHAVLFLDKLSASDL